MFHCETDKKYHPAMKALRIAGFVAMGLAAAALFALVFGFVVMHLWNWLMPGLFGLKTITYWQAFGVLILAKLLFGTFGKHPSDHHKARLKLKMEGKNGATPHPHHPHPAVPPVPPDKWDEYKEFWEKEGRAAFDAYLEKDKTDEKET